MLSKRYIFSSKKSNVKSNVGTSGMGTDGVRYQAILWHTAVFALSRTIRSLFRLKPLLFLGFCGYFPSVGSLAQLDRVLAFEARCCRFESCRGRQNPREIKYLSKTSVKNVKNPRDTGCFPKHRKPDDLVNLPIAKRVLCLLAKKDLIAL